MKMSTKRQRSTEAESIDDLRTPALVCYRSVLDSNARAMRATAERLGCALRPHVKTVKTVEAAEIASGGTRRRITCSTLAEATFFADAGFDDILYAVPITADKLPEALRLHARLEAFHVMVDHPEHVDAICEAHVRAPEAARARKLSVFVGVDCGYHRDGLDADDPASVTLVRRLCESGATCFAGLYTHGGHSYDSSNLSELAKIAEVERDVPVEFARRLRSAGLDVPLVSIGSTPTCSKPPAQLDGVDEIHPGNFLYYDCTQVAIGACELKDVAVRVLTRIVGHYPRSNTLLIDCGWTGASAQGKSAGYGCFPTNPELTITNLKQECGEVSSTDGGKLEYSKYPIGSMLALAPYHSCASTHQHQRVHLLADDGCTIEATWRICKGW
jgi:D-serine deaminase-like pyridoxal phosphate-dependent protein